MEAPISTELDIPWFDREDGTPPPKTDMPHWWQKHRDLAQQPLQGGAGGNPKLGRPYYPGPPLSPGRSRGTSSHSGATTEEIDISQFDREDVGHLDSGQGAAKQVPAKWY